jgi:hypothetical protein
MRLHSTCATLIAKHTIAITNWVQQHIQYCQTALDSKSSYVGQNGIPLVSGYKAIVQASMWCSNATLTIGQVSGINRLQMQSKDCTPMHMLIHINIAYASEWLVFGAIVLLYS